MPYQFIGQHTRTAVSNVLEERIKYALTYKAAFPSRIQMQTKWLTWSPASVWIQDQSFLDREVKFKISLTCAVHAISNI